MKVVDSCCWGLRPLILSLVLAAVTLLVGSAAAQELSFDPDRDSPGDRQIQVYLEREANQLEEDFPNQIQNLEQWQRLRPRLQRQYFEMLGLWPLPESTPLNAKVTRTLKRDGYVVEMLHYQSRPRLYVTANLYRPETIEPGQKLPAILYLCGHAGHGRDGNKISFQSHGIWFAKHGYVCLILDTLQYGEIAGTHHGTFWYDRWWWQSRGYTPAGVECWNAVRGLDYLVSRPDVDPQRIAATGISGGGAATFWVAAADQRVRVAVPVSGMSDVTCYVGDRLINAHCDCMFLLNQYQWPWTQIAALVAPRPMLFINSDHDIIFPMTANRRIANRLETVYSWYGAGDLVDDMVSEGGHDYRRDIRKAVYRFINTHLKDDSKPVNDTEVDLETKNGEQFTFPIEPEQLRVFPTDADIPADQLNTTIDDHFVPMAKVEVPGTGDFDTWRNELRSRLRKTSFHYFPDRIPAARPVSGDERDQWLSSEPSIEFRLRGLNGPELAKAKRVLLVVASPEPDVPEAKIARLTEEGDAVFICEPRGVGATRWTHRHRVNTIDRSHFLLGRTPDTGRVWDVIAAARFLQKRAGGKLPVHVVGIGDSAALAAYAALWESDIAGVALIDPLLTHNQARAPQFLGVLKICNVPEVLGMLAPRPITVLGGSPDRFAKVNWIYSAAGAESGVRIVQE